jgi:IS4 transposase
VDYRDPETKKLHRFITTLNKSMSPGIIALLYFKRWTIEKAFNNRKSNLKETKAWSGEVNSLKNQMRLTVMSYNLTDIPQRLLFIDRKQINTRKTLKYPTSRWSLRWFLFHIWEVFILRF